MSSKEWNRFIKRKFLELSIGERFYVISGGDIDLMTIFIKVSPIKLNENNLVRLTKRARSVGLFNAVVIEIPLHAAVDPVTTDIMPGYFDYFEKNTDIVIYRLC